MNLFTDEHKMCSVSYTGTYKIPKKEEKYKMSFIIFLVKLFGMNSFVRDVSFFDCQYVSSGSCITFRISQFLTTKWTSVQAYYMNSFSVAVVLCEITV